jgi:hypothetical protein
MLRETSMWCRARRLQQRRTGLMCMSCHSLRSPCPWPSSLAAQVRRPGRVRGLVSPPFLVPWGSAGLVLGKPEVSALEVGGSWDWGHTGPCVVGWLWQRVRPHPHPGPESQLSAGLKTAFCLSLPPPQRQDAVL